LGGACRRMSVYWLLLLVVIMNDLLQKVSPVKAKSDWILSEDARQYCYKTLIPLRVRSHGGVPQRGDLIAVAETFMFPSLFCRSVSLSLSAQMLTSCSPPSSSSLPSCSCNNASSV
jgi:hypothetical protein